MYTVALNDYHFVFHFTKMRFCNVPLYDPASAVPEALKNPFVCAMIKSANVE